MTLHHSGEGLELGTLAEDLTIGVVPAVGRSLIVPRPEEVDELIASVVEADAARFGIGGDVEVITTVTMVGLRVVEVLMERGQRAEGHEIEHLADRRVVSLEGRPYAGEVSIMVAVDAGDRAVEVLDSDERASRHVVLLGGRLAGGLGQMPILIVSIVLLYHLSEELYTASMR